MLSSQTILTIFQPIFKTSANPPDVNNVTERESWSETMKVLKRFPEDHLQAVVQYMLRTRTSQFFPRLAEINTASQAVYRKQFPDVHEAWSGITTFIRSNPHGTPYNPDPITARAIAIMGGLWQVRQTPRARQVFEKAHAQALMESYENVF